MRCCFVLFCFVLFCSVIALSNKNINIFLCSLFFFYFSICLVNEIKMRSCFTRYMSEQERKDYLNLFQADFNLIFTFYTYILSCIFFLSKSVDCSTVVFSRIKLMRSDSKAEIKARATVMNSSNQFSHFLHCSLHGRYHELAPHLVPMDYTNDPDVKIPLALIVNMPELKVILTVHHFASYYFCDAAKFCSSNRIGPAAFREFISYNCTGMFYCLYHLSVLTTQKQTSSQHTTA